VSSTSCTNGNARCRDLQVPRRFSLSLRKSCTSIELRELWDSCFSRVSKSKYTTVASGSFPSNRESMAVELMIVFPGSALPYSQRKGHVPPLQSKKREFSKSHMPVSSCLLSRTLFKFVEGSEAESQLISLWDNSSRATICSELVTWTTLS